MALVSGSPIFDPSAGGGAYAPTPPSGAGPATNMAASSPAYGTTGPVRLYLGRTKRSNTDKPTDPKQAKLMGDSYRFDGDRIYRTPQQLMAEFDQFSRKEYLQFRNLLIAAGYTSESADALQVRDAYQGLLKEVWEVQQSGNPTLTPNAILNNLIRLNGLDPSKIGADEDFSTSIEEQLKPQSQTTTSVYDLTPEDARGTLEQAMAQKLGRAPTEEEVEDFIAAAQSRASNNPTTVTQRMRPGEADMAGDEVTVQREGGEVVSTTATSVNRGFDEQSLQRMASNRAEAAPDYASYQSVATYFPALLQALGSTI